MAMAETKFVPEVNGFKFVNNFTLDKFVQYELPFGIKIDLSKSHFGLCGGMCAAALDYFYANEALPEETDPASLPSELFQYLCQRQLDSLTIPVLLKFIEWMMLEDEERVKRMVKTEIKAMTRMLDADKPVILGLVRATGAANPTLNHQVLARAYTLDDTNRSMTIYLYDPNRPGSKSFICLDLSNSKTGLKLEQHAPGANPDDPPLYAFFVVPYAPRATMPRPKPVIAPAKPGFAMAAAPVPAFRLCWPVDSQRINQKFGEHPENYRAFGLAGHEGVDLYAISGANVYAAADGEVYLAEHPAGHPYGLHVRIKHTANGQIYHTIYAHLKKIFVQKNQSVSAGAVIGLANNSGNSFGDHLHLTLKIDGQQTSGYPAGIVDPLPYLTGKVQPHPVEPDKPLPLPSGIKVYTNTELNLRRQPNGDLLTILPAGEQLSVLGEANTERAKIGQQGQWLQVQTASGQAGFVAAWYVQTAEQQAFPPTDLVVYPYDQANLRSGPGTGFGLLATFDSNDSLTILGDANTARANLGKQGQWLQVRAESGQTGFVAAWLVHLTGQVAPETGVKVYPTVMVNVRVRPAIDSNILTVATPGDRLEVLGVKDQAVGKIGQQDQWLNVRTPEGYAGYVAAWLMRLDHPAPVPVPGSSLTVYPTAIAGVNLRAQASANSPVIDTATHNEALKVIEGDLAAAATKIGQQGQWIYCQKSNGKRGWVAGWYLGSNPT